MAAAPQLPAAQLAAYLQVRRPPRALGGARAAGAAA